MELSDLQKELFWSKVNKTDTCWLWTGSCHKDGYGEVRLLGKKYKCHRVSYILSGNTIPEGLILRHSCRSKNCVNPGHLTPGTHKENAADKIRDGTLYCGEKVNTRKLTEEKVREIRARNTENRRLLGKEFGVSESTILRIIQRKKWKHIT
jgi:hypothetical protein